MPYITHASLPNIYNNKVCEKYGVLTACECIPRLMKSHTAESEVVISGCTAIATLGQTKENRMRFSPTVACEVVVTGLNKHVNNAEVAERACMACISLATGHLENAGKLVLAGACPGRATYSDYANDVVMEIELIRNVCTVCTCLVTIQALTVHMANSAVVQHALHFIAIISADLNIRAKYGSETPCCAAIVNALQIHKNSPEVVTADSVHIIIISKAALLCILSIFLKKNCVHNVLFLR